MRFCSVSGARIITTSAHAAASATDFTVSEPGGDAASTFWQNEDMDVDQARKLVLISRDPRSYQGSTTREPGEADPNGATNIAGVYVVDAKDPADLKLLAFEQLPTGHTTTCINDCQWLWTGGPAATTKMRNTLGWTGRPIIVTDLRDPANPVGHTQAQDAVDVFRKDGVTAYSHDVQVDDMGIAWVSGDGGTRGYWTRGRHYDPLKGHRRRASAEDPVPYAGGTTPLVRPTQDDFFGYFDHNAQHITQKVGNYPSGDLLYVTNENIIDCSVAGELKVVSLAGSYDGQGWASTPQNPFRLNLVGHWTPWGKPGSATTGTCSAHWFTVNGNTVVQAWYGQGTRFLDMSDPANPTQVGYFRVPSGTTGVTSGSASATYWHNGYVYVADYRRGIDTLKFDGTITGTPDGVCWGSCDGAKVTYTGTADGTAGGTVPATLSLTLGPPASFGAFTPGVDGEYAAATTANVISSAGDAALSVSDPGHLTNGAFALAQPLSGFALDRLAQQQAVALTGRTPGGCRGLLT